jgi:hypothetical protein
MPPQTRRLLQLIHAWVGERAGRDAIKPADVRFTRRDVRQATGWSDSQLKLHCARLADMEYLLLHGGGRGSLMRYELLYDGQEPGEKRLCGLIEPQDLDNESNQSGLSGEKSGSSLAQVGGMSGSLKTRQTRMNTGVAGEVVGVAPGVVISAKPNSSLAAGVGESV